MIFLDKRRTKALISLHECAGWAVPVLFKNPKDRFSRIKAHFITIYLQDLCDRHEKGVLQDHQRAIAKMGQYKKKRMSATVGSEVTIDTVKPV